jgi:hypothetical protein
MLWIRTYNGPFETAEMILGGIIPIILIIIGTLGNFLCILYLLQHKHRRSPSTYIYLTFLFLVDTLSLYQWNLNYIVMEFNNGTPLSDKSLFLCRIIAFLSFYTLHLSAIFLTLVSIDRTLFLWSHYYRFNMTKRRHPLIISIIVFILLFALDAFLLSFGIIDKNTNKVICYYSLNPNLMNFYTQTYPWIDLVITCIISFIIMIIVIILIIIKLYNRRTNPRHFNKTQRLSLMLIGMCIVYMILTLPNRLCFSVFLSKIINHVYTDTVLLGSNTLLFTRNATNVVFLYIGSKKFRKQLAKFCRRCCCCSRRQHENRVVPIIQVQTVAGTDRCQPLNRY